jgi:diguanylate cyclase (GGDEF)-like protein
MRRVPMWRLAVRRVPAWQLCLAAGALVISLHYVAVHLGDAWGEVRDMLYASANGALAISALLAARRHRTARSTMFLVAGAALAGLAGDLTYFGLARTSGEVHYPSAADLCYLATWPLMAAALLTVVRRRTPGWDLPSVIDSAIVAVSAGYLIYDFIIAPTMSVTVGNLPTLVSVAYPVGDLMILSVGARLLLGAGPRTTALRMLAGYLALVLFADAVYSIQSLNGTSWFGDYLDACFIGAPFLLAAALRHPTMPKMLAPSSAATPDATPGRLIVLALAAVVAPTTMLVRSLLGAEPHLRVAAIVCNVLFLLVLARMAGLVQAQRHAAITDGLTGLRSRRFFEQALRAEAARAARSGAELRVLLLDIDHFKNVNDTYGHNGGDRILVEVAHRLGSLVRSGDLVARYGGEEFAILLPGTDPATARELAERVRRGIGQIPIAVGESHLHHVTVSIGVAGLPAVGTEADELVLAADRALYAAKNAGRDRVAEAGPALLAAR